MTAVPVLQDLARQVAGGEPRAALTRLLTLVCEQLAMETACVVVADDVGPSRVVASVHAAAEADGTAEALLPVDRLGSDRVLAEGSLLVADARTDERLHERGVIGSYAGVPLRDEDGAVFGVLAAHGSTVHTSLNSRDGDVLTGLAEVMAPLVLALGSSVEQPPAAPTGLESLATAVEGAEDVEHLTRPLLEALADLTGLASTYLTVVHEASGVQEIRYARNSRSGFEMPEGLFVPWADTLCKRALEEDRPCTTDVPSMWGDSDAARTLGIQVYVSVPVEMPDGRLWGTLCAADSVVAGDAEAHLPTMRLFARLIGAQAVREEALRRARDEADTDALTGCASRRVVDPWLSREVAALSSTEAVVVAYADLDSFKPINDGLGHAAGDAVLAEVGRRLRATARQHDLVARMGGDEFLVAARLPRSATEDLGHRVRDALTFSMDWQGSSVDVRASVGTACSADYDTASLVAMADVAMYDAKRGALGVP
ncbi:GGDEF domain-containing protein [Nocardioides panacisoli]|uniref:GGDEF domain-containing protein n=1 Tax=Nocardioides panacisoli TaxID=627624 RepID=A0ABP7IAZ3_9ACTN